MPIPESQLETWSHQGAIAQSAGTYEAIGSALRHRAAPYSAKDFSVFLHGSYGNDTNVYRESDVDIVVCLDETYYADTGAMTEWGRRQYEGAFSAATYTYSDFRSAVIGWLVKVFGSSVVVGKKAVSVRANGARRDADVLVCAQYRRYWEASSGIDNQYDEGVCFWTSDSLQVANFPKQHATNCTIKQRDANQRFKPLVRIYKNMRNRMIDDHYIPEGMAPSFFIEGMLWNVPVSHFGGSYEDAFVNTFNWVLKADTTKLTCANELFLLVRDGTHNCWPTGDFEAYLLAMQRYWNDWS